MLVDIKTIQTSQADIEPEEAFRILCKTLSMDFILNDDSDCFVTERELGERLVCKTVNGRDKVIDDRGDLFIALCNVAVNIFPNVSFRNADFIWEKK